MSLPLPESPLLELAELLAADDAKQGLERALVRLTELGIRELGSEGAAPLVVKAKTRTLSLTGCASELARVGAQRAKPKFFFPPSRLPVDFCAAR